MHAPFTPLCGVSTRLEWVDFERDAAAFVVQVGSMLDDDDDELHKRMVSCEWPALIVEPLGVSVLHHPVAATPVLLTHSVCVCVASHGTCKRYGATTSVAFSWSSPPLHCRQALRS